MKLKRKRTQTVTLKTLSELLDDNELTPREQIKYQQMIADGDLMVDHWKRYGVGWDLKVPQVPQRLLTVRQGDPSQSDPSIPAKLTASQASSR